MIHSLATRMASVFVFFGESTEEDTDIYTYACEAIISTFISMVVALSIALLLNRVVEGIVFTLVFVLLRRYTGGHHAKTHAMCILTYGIILACSLLSLSIESTAQALNIAIMIIATVSLVGIFVLAPVGNENKPIGEELRLSSKRKSRLIASTFYVICLLATAYIIEGSVGFIISLSLFSVFASLLYVRLSSNFS